MRVSVSPCFSFLVVRCSLKDFCHPDHTLNVLPLFYDLSIMRKVFLTLVLLAVASGPLVHQSVAQQAPQGRQVAELLSDAYGEESILLVKMMGSVKLDEIVTIVSRDGTYQELGEVEHVYGSYILLKAPLMNEYLAGSGIFQ